VTVLPAKAAVAVDVRQFLLPRCGARFLCDRGGQDRAEAL